MIDYTVEEVLAWIRENDSAGNPEGHTEMHTYHVWEVLNALKEMEKAERREILGRRALTDD